jgi:WD40 repeat protein
MSDKRFKIPLITKFYVDQDDGNSVSVNCVAFHQNGEILATSSDDGALKFWLLSDLLSRANVLKTMHATLI